MCSRTMEVVYAVGLGPITAFRFSQMPVMTLRKTQMKLRMV